MEFMSVVVEATYLLYLYIIFFCNYSWNDLGHNFLFLTQIVRVFFPLALQFSIFLGNIKGLILESFLSIKHEQRETASWQMMGQNRIYAPGRSLFRSPYVTCYIVHSTNIQLFISLYLSLWACWLWCLSNMMLFILNFLSPFPRYWQLLTPYLLSSAYIKHILALLIEYGDDQHY